MDFSKTHRIGIFVAWIISVVVWIYASTDRFTQSIFEYDKFTIQSAIILFTGIIMVAMLLRKKKSEV